MNKLIGYLREKSGRSFHKAILVVPAFQNTCISPAHNPEGVILERALKVISGYVPVAATYFHPSEQFWRYKKDRTYELHPENASIHRGEGHIQYIDYETGNPVTLGATQPVRHNPKVLSGMFGTEHVNSAVQTLKLNGGWILPLVLLVAGVAVGFIIGQNLDLSPKTPPAAGA